ncbi:MAG: translocation/assembly module TamB domain-containing protein [Desulfobulbaceae bacterium]|nr:translocation/assembly module TamB domain-containing protein [Desulfobulbaceae bacterium]
MKKKFLLWLVLIFLCVPVMALYFLFFSNKGLIAGINLAGNFIPGHFRMTTVEGRLSDHLVLKGIEYTNEQTVVQIDRLSFSWKPAALLKKTLDIQAIDISGMDLQLNGSAFSGDESDQAVSAPVFIMPLTVKVEKFSLNSARIAVPDFSDPVELDRITLKNLTGAGSLIQFGYLEVSAPSYNLDASGQVKGGETLFARLSVVFSLRPHGYGPFEGEGFFSGTSEELNINTRLEKPFRGTLSGIVSNLTDEPRWEGVLQTDHVGLSDINKDWPQFHFSSFTAEGGGTADTYSLLVAADADYDSFKNIHVQTSIKGDATGLQFSDTVLSRLNGKLAGQGQLNWEKNFTWQANTTGNQINLFEINPDWPEIVLSEIVLNGQGEQDRYSLKILADTEYDNIHGIHAVTEVNGDSNGLQLTDTELTHAGGRLTGEARLDWREVFSWNAGFKGIQLDPSVVDPRWPGSLDIEFLTEGNLMDSETKGNFTLVALSGKLRDYPLTARGKAALEGNNFALDDFFLKTTGTELHASGRVDETVDMLFQLESSDLSVLWPELGGDINADGIIRGKRRQPAIQMNVTGEELSAYGNSIGTLDAEITADLSPAGMIDAAVQASKVVLAERRIDTLTMELHGTVEDQKLLFDASGDDGIFSLELTGGLAEEIWSGEISRTEIHAGRFGNWHLQEPGTVKLSARKLVISNVCMTGTKASQICLAVSQDQDAGWRTSTNIKSLPLSFLPGVAGKDLNFPLSGTLSGDLSLAGANNNIRSGELSLSADNASVLLALSDEVKYELVWQKNLLHAVFSENRLTAQITSILRDGSAVAASLAIDNFSPASPETEKMELKGTVAINIEELKPLSALTFPLVEPSGSLAGNITLNGSIAHPLFTGQTKLKDGKMVVPQLGITLEDLDILVDGNERLFKLYLSGNSGGGRVQADGELAIETGKADFLKLVISGDKFEAVHLPEMKLYVTPRLEMQLSRQAGDVHGTLRITEGIISPYTLSGSVSPSKDIVFSSENNVEGEEEWPFSADVSIIVDDQVRVDAFGLSSRISGKIQVVDLPGKIITGTGNLDVVEGTFSVYGRELQIKTGQLLFSGGPIDNPGVSVQAENLTRGVTTGIAVSGFLQEPEITFYSDPPMEENEIISRLLMNTSLVSSSGKGSGFIGSVAAGTPIDSLSSAISEVKETLRVDDIRVEAGKTSEDLSLVIGTWLTPKLYISYGKNLLKESGNFNTKYILGHGFSMETETGSTESGADLKYEIER